MNLKEMQRGTSEATELLSEKDDELPRLSALSGIVYVSSCYRNSNHVGWVGCNTVEEAQEFQSIPKHRLGRKSVWGSFLVKLDRWGDVICGTWFDSRPSKSGMPKFFDLLYNKLLI
jgi:hypothetical protein